MVHGAGAGKMNCGARDGAVAGCRKAHREVGVGAGADARNPHRRTSYLPKRQT